jgi:hypothetical protein
VSKQSADAISSRRLPGRSASRRPLGPVSTCRTSREVGRIVITVWAAAATSAGVVAHAAPRARSDPAAASRASWRTRE